MGITTVTDISEKFKQISLFLNVTHLPKCFGSVQKYLGRSKNILNQQKDWVLNSNNLQYNTPCCWIDRTNQSSTKHLMFQALFFFIISYRLRALKTEKINWNIFCKEFCKRLWKKIMLGTSDAWLMRHLSQRPSQPAYYIEDCRIFRLLTQLSTMIGQGKCMVSSRCCNDTSWFLFRLQHH